jgi:hypothetical protein
LKTLFYFEFKNTVPFFRRWIFSEVADSVQEDNRRHIVVAFYTFFEGCFGFIPVLAAVVIKSFLEEIADFEDFSFCSFFLL